MPTKKRKKQSSKTTQSQSQKVIVNIGTKSKPRKKSGRGGLPPPSYQHNLAPTFITAPQVDYTPILAMMQHHARPIVEQAPMPITQTPLSASIQASNAEQMAGEAAIRRAGPTSDEFQTPPSQVRMRPKPSVRKASKKEREAMGAEDYDATFRFTPKETKFYRQNTAEMRKSEESSTRGRGGYTAGQLRSLLTERYQPEGFAPRVVYEKK